MEIPKCSGFLGGTLGGIGSMWIIKKLGYSKDAERFATADSIVISGLTVIFFETVLPRIEL